MISLKEFAAHGWMDDPITGETYLPQKFTVGNITVDPKNELVDENGVYKDCMENNCYKIGIKIIQQKNFLKPILDRANVLKENLALGCEERNTFETFIIPGLQVKKMKIEDNEKFLLAFQKIAKSFKGSKKVFYMQAYKDIPENWWKHMEKVARMSHQDPDNRKRDLMCQWKSELVLKINDIIEVKDGLELRLLYIGKLRDLIKRQKQWIRSSIRVGSTPSVRWEASYQPSLPPRRKVRLK